MIKNVLIVGLGGFLGSSGRYLLHLAMLRVGWERIPLATLTANIAGCLIFGLVLGLSLKSSSRLSPGLVMFVTTGFCGGFTTFSTFAIENIKMIERDAYLGMALYVCASVLLGLLAAYTGLYLAKD